jgi:DNA-binding NarL/FixJ family response regulator
MMTDKLIRILVADDHALVRKSITRLLAKESDLEVIGTVANGFEAVEKAKEEEPDVIVMDVSMPELDGIRATKEIQSLKIPSRIIILSMHHNTTLVQQARKNGAVGYVEKQHANSKLIPAIHAAFEGTTSFFTP